MRKFLVTVALIIYANCTYAQADNDVFYVFKKDWSPAKGIKDAAYFMHPVKKNDTTYICKYYQKVGPMVKQESYKDSDLSIPNGKFMWYSAKGKLDSSGNVVNGKKDGTWNFYNDSANVQRQIIYNNGAWEKIIDYSTKKEHYPDGSDSMMRGKAPDTLNHIMVQASYPGGPAAWIKFIQRNLTVPDRFIDIKQNGTGTVVVAFLIDKEGSIQEVEIIQSCEYSADEEAIRVIEHGGKWIPASIDGRKVLYRQKQSLSFSVSNK